LGKEGGEQSGKGFRKVRKVKPVAASLTPQAKTLLNQLSSVLKCNRSLLVEQAIFILARHLDEFEGKGVSRRDLRSIGLDCCVCHQKITLLDKAKVWTEDLGTETGTKHIKGWICSSCYAKEAARYPSSC
jgi:hypothetical protein